MKLSQWIAVAKHSSRVGALIALPLGIAHADAPAQPAAAPVKAAPAAHSGAPAADGGSAKPAKKKAAVSGDKAAAGKAPQAAARAAGKPAKAPAAAASKPEAAPAPAPAQPEREQLAQAPQPALRLTGAPPAPPAAAGDQPACSLAEPEQPRGGRLEVLGDRFGSAPVVRIAGKPARMIERRAGRISVQIPADSDGGPISLLNDGKQLACGNLVIIGKNR